MTKPVKPKRRYDSSRRREQAQETQRRILEAGHRLFTSQGWNGTTMDSVAAEAGVAVETVYAAFSNKAGLLRRAIEAALKGDPRPADLLERRGPQAVLAEPDPRVALALFADDITERLGRVAPLLDVLRTAGTTDADLAELYGELQANRLKNMGRLVEARRAHQPLRKGLSPAAAADTVWALTSPELYRLLVETRGWSAEQYARWLEGSLITLLLDPDPSRADDEAEPPRKTRRRS